MSFLGGTFDATQVDPAQDFTPLPSGEYPAIITDSEMKPTKSGNGQYLDLTYQVTDGPMKGRLVWERLNLDNPNAKAVEIAQRSLSSLCHAVGVLQVQDSQQLHNRPLVIRVEFVPAGPKNNRDGNEVKAHKKLEGAAQTQPIAPAATQHVQAPAPAQRATTTVPPWAQQKSTA